MSKYVSNLFFPMLASSVLIGAAMAQTADGPKIISGSVAPLGVSRNLLPAPPAVAAPEAAVPAAVLPAPPPSDPQLLLQQASPLAGAPQIIDVKPVAKAKPRVRHVAAREAVVAEDPTPSLQPQTFYATAKASELYSAIADAGGWPRIGGALSPRSAGAAVMTLRKRLAMEGDLRRDNASPTWDNGLTEAVKRFQWRVGLRQTGIVAGATLRQINVTAAARFRQLASTAQRLAGTQFNFADRYVVVNIPSAAVEAVAFGQVAHRYTAVVGAPDHQSPQVSVNISAVNLNPTWTLPASIIKNEVVPKMQKNPGYLQHLRIKILDYHNHEINPGSINWFAAKPPNYIFRQDSGNGDALGLLRIQMYNKDAVYMHDTPTKQFFNQDFRFLSHGCVRVQNVQQLAAWLLEGVGGSPSGVWDQGAIMSEIKTGAREDIAIAHNIPVTWVYMTGWASGDGSVHFRDDVYHLDSIGGDQAQARAQVVGPEIIVPR